MAPKRKNRLMMVVLSGLFAAFVAVATMMISIPTPTKGYINLGDCFVNLSAWLLGPIYGACAAGVGSAMADLLLGYTLYAPATFVIKALMAVVSFQVCRLTANRMHGVFSKVIASVSAELLMVLGYFAFECVVYQSVAASFAGVPANIVQGIGGVVISVPLHEVLLNRIPAVRSLEQGKSPRI